MKTNVNFSTSKLTKKEKKYFFLEKIANLGDSKAFLAFIVSAVAATILWFLAYSFVELTWTEFDWVFEICNLGIFSSTALTAVLATAATIAAVLLLVYTVAPIQIEKMEGRFDTDDECLTCADKLERFLVKNNMKLYAFFLFATALMWFLTAMIAFYDAFPAWMFSDVALAALVAPITVCILSAVIVPITVHIIDAVKLRREKRWKTEDEEMKDVECR